MKYRFRDRSLKKLRLFTEQFMIDRCQVERATGRTFDPNTGVESVGTPTLIYEGQVRITPTRNRGEAVVGEETVHWRDTDFYLPLDAPQLRVDDLLTVTNAQDVRMNGRVFRITDVTHATFQTARKVSGVALAESRTSDNVNS